MAAHESERFPYLFYVGNPGHWAEGANDGHYYQLCFCRTPDESQRLAIGTCFEVELAIGPARAADLPWQWSDEWALFVVGERWTGKGREALAQVERTIARIHEIEPLRQVVFWGAQDGKGDDWSTWSVEQREQPIGGPRYPGLHGPTLYRQPTDDSMASPAPIDAFEQARIDARTDLADQQAGARRQAATADASRARAAGELVAEPIELPRSDWNAKIAKSPKNRDKTQAIRKKKQRVFAVDVATRKEVKHWSPSAKDGAVQMVGYLGDLWAVKTENALIVIDPSADEPTEIARARKKDTHLSIVRNGTVLITGSRGGPVSVYGFANRKLKRIGSFKLKAWWAIERKGVVKLRGDDENFELTNLDDVYEAFAEHHATKI